MLLPTAPGVLFANLQYVHNLGRTQKIQDRQGGPPNPVKLQPGDSPSITFGIGFALERPRGSDLELSADARFRRLCQRSGDPGSPYSYGTFNFGLGYQISQSMRLNVSVGDRRRPEHAGREGAVRAAVQILSLTARALLPRGGPSTCRLRRSSSSRCSGAPSAARFSVRPRAALAEPRWAR